MKYAEHKKISDAFIKKIFAKVLIECLTATVILFAFVLSVSYLKQLIW
jgi:hypothetical protein